MKNLTHEVLTKDTLVCNVILPIKTLTVQTAQFFYFLKLQQNIDVSGEFVNSSYPHFHR